MKLIDNINTRLIDDLKESIKKKSKLSIAASSFSIYSFEALRKELQGVDELRFIFTSPSFLQDDLKKEVPKFFIPHLFKEADLCGGEFELRLRNQLTQRAIAQECSKWVKEKVTFKSNKQAGYALNSIIHSQNVDSSFAWSNMNGFTTADLGITPRKGFPTFIQKSDFPQAQNYLDWFNQIWQDEENLEVVTQQVTKYFEKAFKDNSPEFIYIITLYNIFKDFLDDVNADNLPDDKVGFKESVVWGKLYNFQKDAVIGAINKLEKYKGCILADSVGLGKTFSALGVIKYYEMRNKDVLVLCPKKLEANWNSYRHNDKTNILAKDRLRYDVLFHTDITRKQGQSNGRQLENVNWGNYGLVVIDESHNFRNNNPNAKRENRYQALMRKVIKQGIETKVLMLSATPVNNRFKDLLNQLALAYEGEPIQIDEKLDTTRGINQIFQRAQSAFRNWSKLDASDRNAETLLNQLDFDFFEVLDALTIARSRKHITTYYDTSEVGKFPKRNKPLSITSKLSHDGLINHQEIAEKLYLLNLSVYTPLNYILPSKEALYAQRYEQEVRKGIARLSQRDRDNSLRILMRINLLKRLESSIDSFRITLKGILKQVEDSIEAIDSSTIKEYDGIEAKLSDENFDWEADWGDEENVIGKKVKVHLADMDTIQWKEDMSEDRRVLQSLYDTIENIGPDEDIKLQDLLSLMRNKINNPLNEGNKKLIVFTAFADTANYLYHNLQNAIQNEFGLNTALITGSRKINNSESISNDLNSLLTCFSPISKGKHMLYPHVNESLDILIATDCISEGQNLQDCDYLINYDIHWNPVRIIQRFGRIDRIGSINENITMVNFWPDISLDAYINLKDRVENRMAIVNASATGDDNMLNLDENDLEYRKIQLQKLKDEVVDLEELKEGVTITDLGLNEFRVDLSNYIKTYGELGDIPEGIHAVVKSTELLKPGVIFVLKNVNSNLNIKNLNRLHPHYLLYMNEEGDLIFNHIDSKKILDAVRLLCKGISSPIIELCEQVNKETDEYHNMNHYSSLLKKSIGTILETEEEKEIFSLFKSGGTSATKAQFKGIEDFKLISFLIVK